MVGTRSPTGVQKRPSRVEAIEVRGIHHRASHSFRTTKVKRSFVPDIRQVSDTHRTWLEFQSENWIESCQIWCHRDQLADQADHSPLISPVCGSGRLRDARNLPGELTDMTGLYDYIHQYAVEVRRIHHRAIPSFRATKGDSAEFSAEVQGKFS
ncbi:hypothetical protein Prudu_001762 [Prunus dulcis]|uniref:Uncharacterized protein n=1 Tax=Prunus dulcis TaxID=3755 RepID=A0A4Y1QPB7_PRUDU|nr:hypothetical protein Prudu_001762 [Prunus dulcis]